jgi:DNA-binding NarL/FixJ family response regulator
VPATTNVPATSAEIANAAVSQKVRVLSKPISSIVTNEPRIRAVLGGRIRVLVVDDHPSVRENLRYLVNAERDMDCVGVARDAQEAVRACQELTPDVVILDDDMPGARGVQVLEWIASELPDTRVVMYTLDADVCEVARGLGAGCVLKDANYDVLVRAVRNGAASLPRSAETH